jgi:hypothetical protein
VVEIILQKKGRGVNPPGFPTLQLNAQGRKVPPPALLELCLQNGNICHRADCLALRAVKVTDAFHAGGGINHVRGPLGD